MYVRVYLTRVSWPRHSQRSRETVAVVGIALAVRKVGGGGGKDRQLATSRLRSDINWNFADKGK